MAKAINSMSTLDMARDAVLTLQTMGDGTPEEIAAAQAYVRRLEQERASGKIDPWTREGGIDDRTPRERGSGGGVGGNSGEQVGASDAQKSYIRRLVAERLVLDTDAVLRDAVLSSLSTITKVKASAVIEKLNAIPAPPSEANQASDAQKNYIRRLMPTRWPAEMCIQMEQSFGQLTKKAASATIETLQKLPERFTPATLVQTNAESTAPALTDGIYKDPQTGNIYKAQYNKAQGNGSYLYCKVMARVDEVVGRGGKLRNKITWTYAGSAAKTLQPEWKLSAQDATEFGKLYGICIYCGAELTDEESIDRAVGKICWGKHHG